MLLVWTIDILYRKAWGIYTTTAINQQRVVLSCILIDRRSPQKIFSARFARMQEGMPVSASPVTAYPFSNHHYHHHHLSVRVLYSQAGRGFTFYCNYCRLYHFTIPIVQWLPSQAVGQTQPISAQFPNGFPMGWSTERRLSVDGAVVYTCVLFSDQSEG